MLSIHGRVTEAGLSARPKSASSAGIAVMNPVRVFRRFRDLRQAALAEAAGIRQGYLSEIERGAKAPSLATARALARALEVDLELLLPAEA